MRIIASDVVEAGPQLERSLQRGLQTRELAARCEWAEIIDSAFDLAARVDARKALLPIDLHEVEQTEGAHLPVCLWKEFLPFAIQHVQGFECRVRAEVLDTARDFPQIQIAHHLRPRAVIAFEPLEQVAGLVEDDQFVARVEDLIDARVLR